MIAKGLFEPLMDASDAALDRVLDAGAAPRSSAFDLLAADAFVTWAFEAAAEEPTTIASRADAAMRRISDRAVTYLDGGFGSPVAHGQIAPHPSPANSPHGLPLTRRHD